MPTPEVLVLTARLPPVLLAGAPILASLGVACVLARVSLQVAIRVVRLASGAPGDFAPSKSARGSSGPV